MMSPDNALQMNVLFPVELMQLIKVWPHCKAPWTRRVSWFINAPLFVRQQVSNWMKRSADGQWQISHGLNWSLRSNCLTEGQAGFALSELWEWSNLTQPPKKGGGERFFTWVSKMQSTANPGSGTCHLFHSLMDRRKMDGMTTCLLGLNFPSGALQLNPHQLNCILPN